jgi:MFS family permease
VLRFLAGIGLGGVLPVALALVNEYARAGKGSGAMTTMMTGYHVGAVITALLGIVVISSLGWRMMFVLGAAPALVLLPLMLRYLPESAWYLDARSAEVSGGTGTGSAEGNRHNPGHPAVPVRLPA